MMIMIKFDYTIDNYDIIINGDDNCEDGNDTFNWHINSNADNDNIGL